MRSVVAIVVLASLAMAHASEPGANHIPNAPTEHEMSASMSKRSGWVLKARHLHRALDETTLGKSTPVAVPASPPYELSRLPFHFRRQDKHTPGGGAYGRASMKGKGTMEIEGKTGSYGETHSLEAVKGSFSGAALHPLPQVVMRHPNRRSMLACGLAAVAVLPKMAKAADEVSRIDKQRVASTKQGMQARQLISTLDTDVLTLRRELEMLEMEQGPLAWSSTLDVGAGAFAAFLSFWSWEQLRDPNDRVVIAGVLAPAIGFALGRQITPKILAAAEELAAAAKQAMPQAPPESKSRMSASIARVEDGVARLKECLSPSLLQSLSP
eukprot:gnl/TRDRNA2_/TRDRNA2_169859_c0_seq2.p1 gnl/TRDRNA2_/TRDRNA2_169859_c0~~gnl/TRDRNA2_/TRDRNA2_169859_c0_seq2.p1  ORF type:complete len:370 (+),score=44.97 gnl/TRDRNA2_/TRDRNA2_169859_c0_seq2:134-1111(+)